MQEGLPPARETNRKIKLKGSRPNAGLLYCTTPKEDKSLQKYIKEAIGIRIVFSSKASYDVGVLFLAKKTGEIRIVTYYRSFNQVKGSGISIRYP